MRIVLLGLIGAAVILAARELRAISEDATSRRFTKHQKAYRIVGMLLVFSCFALIYRGTYLPTPRTFGGHISRVERVAVLHYLLYWTVTAMLALPLIPLAILDSRLRFKSVLKDSSELIKMHKELQAFQDDIIEKHSAND